MNYITTIHSICRRASYFEIGVEDGNEYGFGQVQPSVPGIF